MRGAPVAPDREQPASWRALQEPGLVARERDRRAILAMAGTYRVTFDFLEVADFAPGGKANAPYQSWATEKVYVDQDQPGFVSLVHILEMRMLDKDRVRDTSRSAFAQQGTLTLRGAVDKLGLYRPLFERADEIEAQPSDARPVDERDSERVIRAALADMGVPL